MSFKKLNKIKQKFQTNYINLEQISHNNNYEIKIEVCNILNDYFITYFDKYEKILLNLLNDKDELVRIEAIEVLGAIGNVKYAKNLLILLKDKSWLVRASVFEALGDIKAIEYIQKLKSLLSTINNNEEKVRVYYALYKLSSKKKYLTLLLDLLNDNNYRVRCSTANLLYYLVNKKNKKRILKNLNKVLKKEITIAGKSSIAGSIKDINLKK